jgi:beta-propeller repeat-containing protein
LGFKTNYIFKENADRAGAIGLLANGNRLKGLAIAAWVVFLVSLCDTSRAAPARANDSFGRLPLMFERRESGADEFFCRGPGYVLFLSPAEAGFVLRPRLVEELKKGGPGLQSLAFDTTSALATGRVQGTVALRMKLEGAQKPVEAAEVEELPTKVNYFLGNDPAQWRRQVPTYANVRYREIYPGVDIIYYGNQTQLEFDFVVAPGADPARIDLSFDGAERIEIDEGGDLVLHTKAGPVRQHRPVVYQEIDGRHREVDGHYMFREDACGSIRGGDQSVGFKIGAYDRHQPLVIDPVLIYSTYLGGTGMDRAHYVAVDSDGSAYVVGDTASTNFPVAGALNPTFNGGGNDVFVAKLDPQGTNFVFATYLGGNQGDFGYALALGGNGDIYLTGVTSSTNFPVTTNAVFTTNRGFDAFLVRLDATGTDLLYSTYLGGSLYDVGLRIAVDGSGNAYVTGRTASNDFPTNGFASSFGSGLSGSYDVFIAKLTATDTNIAYSGYLGGSGDDYIASIAVDAQGRAVAGGFTTSSDFPCTNAMQTNILAGFDGFVTRFSADGSTKLFSTYLGGNGNDFVDGLALDVDGNIYLTGSTSSTDFPTRNAISATNHGLADVFVTKLEPNGTNIIYSTYLGGSMDTDEGWGIAVDVTGSAYVVGVTFSNDFFTTNAVQAIPPGGNSDAFLLKLATNGAAIEFSTFLGGRFADFGNSVALDGDGNAYVVGVTSSTSFPTVPSSNGLQNAFGGGMYDGFIARIFPGNAALRAERGTTNDVSILWPRALLNFELQSTDLLMATNNWIAVTNSPLVAGEDYFLTFSAIGGPRFFRLSRNP